MSTIAISNETLDRYNRPGPRYTSYPTVPFWSKEFGEADYLQALRDLTARPDEALSLYVHLPFCAERCHYCGCNATVTNKEAVIDSYLDRLEREIHMVIDIIGSGRPVLQLHWGGGTPNHLNEAQLTRLYGLLASTFVLDPQAEISLEIDPRIATWERLQTIRSLGFNRISLGVQDFEPQVQQAIGRIQPEALTRDVYRMCRDLAFDSINLDLVYGLPGQTDATFRRTLQEIIKLAPDRVACFSYAHLPDMRHNQRLVDVTLMPNHYDKFGMFQMAVDLFGEAGYDWVGMDHFAIQSDELAVAARERRLHRNFMGYTTLPAQHMLAFGSSSIGDLADCFVQNDAKLGNYQRAIDAGHLPVVRGMRRSEDDNLRRQVITHLMCNLELPYNLTEPDFGQDVRALLPDEIAQIAAYADEGLVELEPDRLVVTTLGRYFVRILGMPLDAYLQQSGDQPVPKFSKTI